MGFSCPSGIGAGVEWSLASFWARERPEEGEEEEEAERAERFRKSVARKAPLTVVRGPWA
jgi:hypothetical protein